MDFLPVKQEQIEKNETLESYPNPESDLVSYITCEDYQLMESMVNESSVVPIRNSSDSQEKSPQKAASQTTHHCPECNRSCPSANAVRLHRRRIHNMPVKIVKPEYRCAQCDQSFPTLKKQRDHEKNHDQLQCPVCGKSVAKHLLKEHTAAHKGSIRCDACDKALSSYRSLKLHRKLVHASDNLASHMKAEKLNCPECDLVFFNTAQLNSHMRSHQKQRCPICKSLRSKSSIQEHIASHGGTFWCNVCDCAFSSKRRLKIHMESRHVAATITRDDGKYGCLHCRRVFDSEKEMKVHAVVHTKKQCTICGRKVTQKHYHAHMALHAYRS